jgi:photosystem II stability/assembly factor-like uncharacterized protein
MKFSWQMRSIVIFLMAVLISCSSGAEKVTSQTYPDNLAIDSPWQPVFLRKMLENSNFIGGEGGQWLQALAIDSIDGSFLMAGTDVGGLYRSTNGGKYWESANFGYYARGTSGIYIDPQNRDRVLAVGANSAEGDFNRQWHGLYLSEDRGASWQFVLPLAHSGYRDVRQQIAFDRSSVSDGKSQIIYYSSQQDGLFKSTDAGKSFQNLTQDYSGAYLAVHPTNGNLFIAATTGLFTSTDGGKSISKILDGAFRGISFSLSQANNLYVNDASNLYFSQDAGKTFNKLNSPIKFGTPDFFDLTVHPTNSDRLWVMNRINDFEWYAYSSIDGGKTWRKGKQEVDNKHNFLPFNGRRSLLAWHPLNPDKMWSFGGDWLTSSSDGGLTWRWDANGYNGIMIGGLINFNPHYPNQIFFASQDYDGSFSSNYGNTWRYINISGNDWGGHSYGGIAVGNKTFITAYAESWDAQRYLATSLNGDFQVKRTKIPLNGANVSLVDPQNPQNLFIFDHHSRDGGVTWTKMNGCDGVFSYSQNLLIGRDRQNLVTSNNGGKTWRVLVTLDGEIADAAYDFKRDKYYIVANDRLYQWQNNLLSEINTPRDRFQNRRIATVALDPVNPRIVYVGSHQDLYKTNISVMRSLDSGNNWQVLTSIISETGNKIDGSSEVTALRVHPQTRELWVTTSCYGIWKYSVKV